MNAIIKELFEVYLEGKLCVKPHLSTETEVEELETVEKRCAPTMDDLRFLENYISKYGREQERCGFFAGFHTAFDLLAELSGMNGGLG